MKIYAIERTVVIPSNIEEVWEFFSTPRNLNEITPQNMSFEIQTDVSRVKTYAGLLIQYKIRPFANIPFKWVTEITHCESQKFFVDEQRFGPYSFWHHQHHFKSVEGGVEMRDIVHYALPFGILGRLVHALFIKKQIEGIFEYRSTVIASKFSGK